MQDPNPDLIVMSQLRQIANHGLAALRLIEDGLDNPARVVVRTLLELSLQLIAFSCDRKALTQYATARTPEEIKTLWYKLLRSKQLLKQIEAIDNETAMPRSLNTFLVERWEKLYERYSQAVHPSLLALTVGSVGRRFETEIYESVLFGKAVEASRETVWSVLDTLSFVVTFYPQMLVALFGFSIPTANEQWRLYWNLRKFCMTAWLLSMRQEELRQSPISQPAESR
jgi:hypothetical protein